MKRYLSLFETELGCCNKEEPCEPCKEGKPCPGKNESLNETCPESSTPSGGRCKRSDNSGYLKGKCDKGYIWDDEAQTCHAMAKESIQEKFNYYPEFDNDEISSSYEDGSIPTLDFKAIKSKYTEVLDSICKSVLGDNYTHAKYNIELEDNYIESDIDVNGRFYEFCIDNNNGNIDIHAYAHGSKYPKFEAYASDESELWKSVEKVLTLLFNLIKKENF